MHCTTSAHNMSTHAVCVLALSDVRIREGVGVDVNESCTVDEDLRSSGALSHQLRPVLQLRVLLLQNLCTTNTHLTSTAIEHVHIQQYNRHVHVQYVYGEYNYCPEDFTVKTCTCTV